MATKPAHFEGTIVVSNIISTQFWIEMLTEAMNHPRGIPLLHLRPGEYFATEASTPQSPGGYLRGLRVNLDIPPC